ncbi:hypothetical protein [Stutzerimonas tarimensis]|uniref:DUF3085 domain-containing protein n=1 Tax=Stutzerimonas tarimensis TaxID=1507735 RepID=A0ABV7T9I5_9GAMM
MPSPIAQARRAVLSHPDALDCTLYRPDERDGEEERDLGDGRLLFTGPFQPPADWDASTREEYFDGNADDDFLTAFIEGEAEPGSPGHFTAEPGDYAAVVGTDAKIAMYYVYDRLDGDQAGGYVLIREPELD